VRREVRGLKRDSKIRPDLQLFFPGRMLLTDVAVSHPLTENFVAKRQSSGIARQEAKRRKYSSVAMRLIAELLPFSVETCGGMADDSMKLVEAMGEEGEEAMGTWTKAEIMRYILSLTAVDLSLYAEFVKFSSNVNMALCWPAVHTASGGREWMPRTHNNDVKGLTSLPKPRGKKAKAGQSDLDIHMKARAAPLVIDEGATRSVRLGDAV
jgi:predicted nuclease with RNAse H fold